MTLPCNKFPHARSLPSQMPCPICLAALRHRTCACCGAVCFVSPCHEKHSPDVPATIGPDWQGVHWCPDCATACPSLPGRAWMHRPPAVSPEEDVRQPEVCLPRGSRARRKPSSTHVQGDLFRDVEDAVQLDLFEGVDL